MDIPIIFQDQDLVVFSKPAGVVVNTAKSVKEKTVQDWFESKKNFFLSDDQAWQELVPSDFDDLYGNPQEIFLERKGMVHRLDKNTSGVLVFANNPGSLVNLLSQFRKRAVIKKYLCLVHGKVQPDRDVVSAPVGRAQGKNRKKFQVRSDGRTAETEYQVLHYWPDFSEVAKEALPKNVTNNSTYQQGFTLVQATPHTGRTHQIRVHLAHLGHPLVGDDLYNGKKRSKLDSAWCPRHFLHASEITLTHPRTKILQKFEAPLSGDQSASDLFTCLNNYFVIY
jgi:23S rRNA pseudouridine1911/1915/1917 synthase